MNKGEWDAERRLWDPFINILLFLPSSLCQPQAVAEGGQTIWPPEIPPTSVMLLLWLQSGWELFGSVVAYGGSRSVSTDVGLWLQRHRTVISLQPGLSPQILSPWDSSWKTRGCPLEDRLSNPWLPRQMLSRLLYHTHPFFHQKGELLKILSRELSEKQNRGHPVQSGILPHGELFFSLICRPLNIFPLAVKTPKSQM